MTTYAGLVCPRCDLILRPTFDLCVKGHFVCKHCGQHIDIHEETNQGVESTECGDLVFVMDVLNQFHRNISDWCQKGCGYRDNIINLAAHEDSCEMIYTHCAINACPWKGRLPTLVKHVEDNHPGSLVDLTDVENTFQLSFEHPVLLLTQFNNITRENHLYWIRLHKNNDRPYVMMQYQGYIDQKVKKNFLLTEYSVSPIEFTKLSVTCDVELTKSDEQDILNNMFIINKGTELSILNAEEYVIKIKDPSAIPRKLLETYLECFVCFAVMCAPIRLCLTGHSICSSCSKKINNKCPKCQNELSLSGRNYTLEQLAENLLLE